uniref:PseudoU_synth_2 domain-containing protein n=1 Tax=Macrostomum lignano TaxID=282301 RepID=A0A1I8FFD0_9PLAT
YLLSIIERDKARPARPAQFIDALAARRALCDSATRAYHQPACCELLNGTRCFNRFTPGRPGSPPRPRRIRSAFVSGRRRDALAERRQAIQSESSPFLRSARCPTAQRWSAWRNLGWPTAVESILAGSSADPYTAGLLVDTGQLAWHQSTPGRVFEAHADRLKAEQRSADQRVNLLKRDEVAKNGLVPNWDELTAELGPADVAKAYAELQVSHDYIGLRAAVATARQLWACLQGFGCLVHALLLEAQQMLIKCAPSADCLSAQERTPVESEYECLSFPPPRLLRPPHQPQHRRVEYVELDQKRIDWIVRLIVCRNSNSSACYGIDSGSSTSMLALLSSLGLPVASFRIVLAFAPAQALLVAASEGAANASATIAETEICRPGVWPARLNARFLLVEEPDGGAVFSSAGSAMAELAKQSLEHLLPASFYRRTPDMLYMHRDNCELSLICVLTCGDNLPRDRLSQLVGRPVSRSVEPPAPTARRSLNS